MKIDLNTSLKNNIHENSLTKMKFKHHQLVEIYSALKEGSWINLETRNELITRLENYLIEVAMHNDFDPKVQEEKK